MAPLRLRRTSGERRQIGVPARCVRRGWLSCAGAALTVGTAAQASAAEPRVGGAQTSAVPGTAAVPGAAALAATALSATADRHRGIRRRGIGRGRHLDTGAGRRQAAANAASHGITDYVSVVDRNTGSVVAETSNARQQVGSESIMKLFLAAYYILLYGGYTAHAVRPSSTG